MTIELPPRILKACAIARKDLPYFELGDRNRIWAALAEEYPEDWQTRRNALGIIAARETLACWEDAGQRTEPFQALPSEILNCARSWCAGLPPDWHRHWAEFGYQVDEYGFLLGHGQAGLDGVPWVFNVPFVARAALYQVIARDFGWGGFDVLDVDFSEKDPHTAACSTLAGWSSTPTARHLAYWQHWFDDLLPQVCDPRWPKCLE